MRSLIAAVVLASAAPARAQSLSDAYSAVSARMSAARSAQSALSRASAAPDFALMTPSGEPHGLTEFRGRVVVLEFWASWSGPSLAGAPARVALARRCDVAMLDIGVGEDGSGAAAFAAAAAPAGNETILLDADSTAFAAYGGRSLPLAVIVDRGGKVAAVVPGAGAALVEAAIRALAK
jgi:thiol-disulfide isomerase/thioredoxin